MKKEKTKKKDQPKDDPTKEKINLWYSESKAKEGKFFYVPTGDGKNVEKCTGITLDDAPPSDTSEFLAAEFLDIKPEWLDEPIPE